LAKDCPCFFAKIPPESSEKFGNSAKVITGKINDSIIRINMPCTNFDSICISGSQSSLKAEVDTHITARAGGEQYLDNDEQGGFVDRLPFNHSAMDPEKSRVLQITCQSIQKLETHIPK
jgi:hypothetical protein